MIVKIKHLRNKNIDLAMVDGGFDPLHDGHIRYFKKSREKFNNCKIVCCLASDKYIKKKT